MITRSRGQRRILACLAATLLTSIVQAQSAPGSSSPAAAIAPGELVAALRGGGHVLVMRHASAPSALPDAATADSENTGRERQLDDDGRRTSIAMGEAMRALQIPIGRVMTSPTYRAQQTARLAQLPNPLPVDELGEGDQNMGGISEAQAEWLQVRTRQLPRGSNIVMVTHLQNFARAFPEWGSTLSQGEMAIFRPDGNGGSLLVTRLKIEEWPGLRHP